MIMWKKINEQKTTEKTKNVVDKIKKMRYTPSCPAKTGQGQWKKNRER